MSKLSEYGSVQSLVAEHPINDGETRTFVATALQRIPVDGRRVLVIIPDNTRTLPMPAVFAAVVESWASRAAKLTVLVAAGTHPKMSHAELQAHLAPDYHQRTGVAVLQHEWDNPAALVELGTIPRAEVRQISTGVLDEAITVRINKQVLEHDLVLLIGPVFPHELVGLSGGFKYYFPGVSGAEMVHQSHWLGSIVVNPDLIGRKVTPVRDLIHRGAAMVPTASLGVSIVMRGHNLHGVFVGGVTEAWSEAADLCAQINVQRVPRRYHTVIACIPPMYTDLWTGSKSMTKVQTIVEDGGTLILYGPHIKGAAASHGDWHSRIGYHVPDFVLQNLDRFAEVPRAVLGDLIQLKGPGRYENGVELPRMDVRLATGISAAGCQALNLGYTDPATIRLQDYMGREHEGVLVVPDAGEVLWLVEE